MCLQRGAERLRVILLHRSMDRARHSISSYIWEVIVEISGNRCILSAVVFSLECDAVVQRSDIVAEVQRASRAVASENDGARFVRLTVVLFRRPNPATNQ